MKKKTFQIPSNIQYGLIGGTTMVASSVLGIVYFRHIATNVWQIVLITSLVSAFSGVILGMIAFKDPEKVRSTLWKIGIFLMSLGFSWAMISTLRLFGK